MFCCQQAGDPGAPMASFQSESRVLRPRGANSGSSSLRTWRADGLSSRSESASEGKKRSVSRLRHPAETEQVFPSSGSAKYWRRPTHTGENTLLYSAEQCESHAETPSQTYPGQRLTSISALCGPVKLKHKLTISGLPLSPGHPDTPLSTILSLHISL